MYEFQVLQANTAYYTSGQKFSFFVQEGFQMKNDYEARTHFFGWWGGVSSPVNVKVRANDFS